MCIALCICVCIGRERKLKKEWAQCVCVRNGGGFEGRGGEQGSFNLICEMTILTLKIFFSFFLQLLRYSIRGCFGNF